MIKHLNVSDSLSTIVVVALYSVVAMVAGHAYAGTHGMSTKPPQVEDVLDRLFRAETLDELSRQPELWRSELSPEQRKFLVIALIPHLWSQQSLGLELPEGTVIETRYDWSKGIPSEVQRAERRLRHDVSMSAGRAAWAIEELLLCSLPVVIWAGSDDAARSTAIARACQGIVAAMEMPLVDGTERAPVEQRLAAARSEKSRPRLLAELAKDRSPDVRAAVAANRKTPYHTVTALLNDPEEVVRAAAEENHRRARSIGGD